jgi:hypothetical protein
MVNETESESKVWSITALAIGSAMTMIGSKSEYPKYQAEVVNVNEQKPTALPVRI